MDGLLVIDKPKDFTSFDIVAVARKTLKVKKIGHTGTLDPNATGILVLALGKATKLIKYFTEDRKTYQCTFLIGRSYDTDDTTGNLIAELDASKLSESQVINALKSFIGKNQQVPPAFSAIKVQGRKMYELARKNKELPELKPRDIEIFGISEIEVYKEEKTIVVKAIFDVSKGTYIRSIARDLGVKLNNVGCLMELRRTRVSNFTLADSITMEDLINQEFNLKDPFDFLALPRITVSETIANDIQFGRFIDMKYFSDKKDTIIYNSAGEVLAIYTYDSNKNTMRMSVKWA
ncbi:MAG: tRNA pseudouridine(55) synthase TruB [Candidatus Izemoplasmatales bacterium]|nr:tRNA pseudouridine(55) synthase TruB [Candidatus Izemoplasmatales bacterium]